MKADCHIHMVLDGVYYKDAIAAHAQSPREDIIARRLERYRALGYTYLRDGGDRWNVGVKARAMAENYGIVYRTPVFPICKKGHYGGFIGRSYETENDFISLLREVRGRSGDFVKLMISGLMDFDRYGVLTDEPLTAEEIHLLIHIAHEEGFSVMVHANGAETVMAAAEAGVESVEHGAYLNHEALHAMTESGTVWVPTLSTVGNLLGTGRFREEAVRAILDSAMENVVAFSAMGGILAPGSDAGAYAVPHGRGGETEYMWLEKCLGGDCGATLSRGIKKIQEKF